MTQPTKEEWRSRSLVEIDPKPDAARAEKLDTQKFWVLWVPLGAIFGIFVCVASNSGGPFLPVWFISTFVMWGAFGGKKS